MINQILLVGRLVQDPQIKELENGKKQCIISLGVPRDYKNINGEYETDFIDCILLGGVAETTAEYCKKGDTIGVRGKLARLSGEDLRVIAGKVSFLSSRKENEEE